jgi:hypothetical protein
VVGIHRDPQQHFVRTGPLGQLAAAGPLNPMIAGAAMAASSCLVVSNSLRLTRFRGATPHQPLFEHLA